MILKHLDRVAWALRLRLAAEVTVGRGREAAQSRPRRVQCGSEPALASPVP